MWNSFGSIRDRVRENANRVRENAKAAAQVAHGMLQVAAAEDEDLDPSLNAPTSTSDQPDQWDDWGPSGEQAEHHPEAHQQVESPHALPPPPPPSNGGMPAALMPPPLAPPSVPSSTAGGGKRKARYVVTGLEETGRGGVLPLRPAGGGVLAPGAVGGGVAPGKEVEQQEDGERGGEGDRGGDGDGDGVGGRGDGGHDANGWDGDGNWEVAEVSFEAKTEERDRQVPSEAFDGAGAQADVWKTADEWNSAPALGDATEPSAADGRVDDWGDGKEWDVIERAEENDKPRAEESDKPSVEDVGGEGRVEVGVEIGTDGTSGKLGGDVSKSSGSDVKPGKQGEADGAGVELNKPDDDQSEQNAGADFDREWGAPVEEKPVPEPESFWGTEDGGNAGTAEWDDDWNVATEEGTEHDAGKDWDAIASRVDEHSKETALDEKPNISEMDRPSTTGEWDSIVGEDTHPTADVPEDDSSSRQKPQESSFTDGSWQAATEEQAQPSQNDTGGFGWEEMQAVGDISNDNAAVDWFSAGDAQKVAHDEDAHEPEAFFDDISKGNPKEEVSIELPHSSSPKEGQTSSSNDGIQSSEKLPGVENTVDTPANQREALMQESDPSNSDVNSGTRWGEQARTEVPNDDFLVHPTSAFASRAENAIESISSSDQQAFKSPFVPKSSLSPPPADTIAAMSASPRIQDQLNSETATLMEEIRQLKVETDSFTVNREASESTILNLKQLISSLQEDLSGRDRDIALLKEEKSHLVFERDELARDKSLIEKERDAAIEKGGDGIREARGVIELMRTSQDAVERREAVITEQIESLRADLDRISDERNSFLTESDDLKIRLREVEAQSKSVEEGLGEQVKSLQNETEIARLERDKALTAAQLHVREREELLETEKATSASLVAAQGRIRELQCTIDRVHGERNEESSRIEALSTQVGDMKGQITNVMEERNALHNEKLSLQRDMEALKNQGEEYQRALEDGRRAQKSLLSERDEARTRYGNLRDQLKDLSTQLEATTVERDRLVQERAIAASSSTSVTDRETALAKECQQKTAMIAGFQRKLTVALTKIEKLSTQKSTYQRQRDDAGARLRAAGAEFAQLTSKLEIAISARDKLQEELNKFREEKDRDFSQIQDLSEQVAEVKILTESLERSSKQVKDLEASHSESLNEISKLTNAKSALQQECNNLATEANTIQGKYDVVLHERDMLQSKLEALDEEKNNMQLTINSLQSTFAEISKAKKSAEADLATVKEKAAFDIGMARAELSAEQKIRAEQSEKLANLQNMTAEHEGVFSKLSETVQSSLRRVTEELEVRGRTPVKALESINNVNVSECDDYTRTALQTVANVCSVLTSLAREHANVLESLSELHEERNEMTRKLKCAQQDSTAVTAKDKELLEVRDAYDTAMQQLESAAMEKSSLEMHCRTVEAKLHDAEMKAAELDDRVRVTSSEMLQKIENNARVAAEERGRLSDEVEEARSKLHSIWKMLQKSMASQQIEFYSESIDDYEESSGGENVAVLALRAAASIVAELDRNRMSSEEISRRLGHAEAEVTRLTDRAEIAEKERNAFRGSNERLEKKIKIAKGEGEAAAKEKFEAVIAQYVDELDDTKHELESVTDRAKKSEKEAGELRALCSKLTSQFNGRTNELDEAEEKIVYLQDQVTNLQEDLEEAHRRLREHEEETAEARRSDVDRLSAQLKEAIGQVERLETECARLQEGCEKAESAARESELVAETHRRAESNLQIAIEQLEAGLESTVEQRTIEIQKKMQEAEERCRLVMKREEEMAMTENKLGIRDDEIKELRSAIGRLADERVELKLELEKSLSRLNHPDAGGELVDRRVVRQLLVSYFRVGSVRRRDVLELMSRMLAFSEGDKVAVGLKRRALMERIGSLVQAPEMEDAQLAPLGTVSDKWIEFLMKETEEGEDQEKGW
eukprot:GFKZ01014303.1.p1 GENE.GFKZ01014303.1~~GFKZ01014303.1.p1  ORF type:complete len:1965 (+),score=426.89 GFKZ01014303.1:106-5895(+)